MPLEDLTEEQLDGIRRMREQLLQGGPRAGLLKRLRSIRVTETRVLLENGETRVVWAEAMNRRGVTLHLSLSLGWFRVARSLARHVLFDGRLIGEIAVTRNPERPLD